MAHSLDPALGLDELDLKFQHRALMLVALHRGRVWVVPPPGATPGSWCTLKSTPLLGTSLARDRSGSIPL
jgi:hypothetical protein